MIERKAAAELMAELESDAAFLVRKGEREKVRKQLESELAKAEAPLVEALNSVGANVNSVWDLVLRQEGYTAAIAVLLEHVRHNYPDRIREGILRALATPDAKVHWKELVDFFEQNSLALPADLRYLAAVVLNGAADDSVIEDVIRLVRDARYGFDRAPLLFALQRSADSKAKMLLLELRDDPVLGKEVKRIRRKSRLKTSRKP